MLGTGILMKRNIFYITAYLVFVIILNSSCLSDSSKTLNNSSKITLTAALGGMTYLDTNKIVHISTIISNLTEDTIRFMSMSCSYEDFFLVGENDKYSVKSRYDC